MTHIYSARGLRQSAVSTAIIGLHVAVFLIVLNDQIPVGSDRAQNPPHITVLPPKPLPRQILAPDAPDRVEIAGEVVREPILVIPPFDDSEFAPNVPAADRDSADGQVVVRGPVERTAATLQGRSSQFAAAVRACYPAAARRNGEEGRLLLAVTIGAQGQLRSWQAVQGTGFPRLDSAAACVLDKLNFNGAREDGRAVESEVLLPIVFRLD